MFIGNRDGIYSVQKVEELELQYSMKCKPCVTSLKLVCCSLVGGGGGLLPMIAHIGRLPLKVIPFPGFRHIKMQGFRELKYTKGQANLSVVSCKRIFN